MAARVSGQWSVVSGSEGLLCRARPRASRRWSTAIARVSAASAVSSIGGYAYPPYALLRGLRGGLDGGALRVRGAWVCRAGAPGHRSARTPPCPLSGVRGPACRASGHCLRASPSPAPPFAWGLGPRRRRVPRAVAPVAEGGRQGPEQPDIDLPFRDAEYRPPSQESWPLRPPVGPPCPNQGPADPFIVLLRHPTPRRYFQVPPVPPEEHGIERLVYQCPGGL